MLEVLHTHTFSPGLLSERSKVLDLGANRGQFIKAIHDRFGCDCVAVEPMPELLIHLPEIPGLRKFHAAVADQDGESDLNVYENVEASSMYRQPGDVAPVAARRVRTVTLPALMRELRWDRIDLLKVDIEGAELPLFSACPDELLRRVGQITIEFHDFNGLVDTADVRTLLQRFMDLKFFCLRASHKWYHDTWMINKELHPLSPAQRFVVSRVERNMHLATMLFNKYVLGRRGESP